MDTSAFVPLLVAEPSSRACRRFWNDADRVASSRLLYVEVAAALAQARRMRRLSDDEHDGALELLEHLWSEVNVIEVDETTVSRAAALACRCGLRGYDAVHCASAEQLGDSDFVAATGDRRLLGTWADLGIATFDTNPGTTPSTQS